MRQEIKRHRSFTVPVEIFEFRPKFKGLAAVDSVEEARAGALTRKDSHLCVKLDSSPVCAEEQKSTANHEQEFFV